MSSLNTSTSKQVSNGTKTETATTTPNLMPNLQSGYSGLVDRTNQLALQDPSSIAPPAGPLQNQAFANAGNLGGWQTALGQSAQMAGAAGSAPANLTQPWVYQTPQIGNVALPDA